MNISDAMDKRRAKRERKVTPAERRTGWNNGLSSGELSLRGSRLLTWLLSTANERGLQLKEMAEAIGVTYGYIHQLRTGLKPIPGLSEQVIDACAKFLGVPRLSVLIASDIVRVDDFYDKPETLSTYFDPALHFMQCDPEWGPFVHPSVFHTDPKVQQLLILLYEKATGRKVIPTKVHMQELLEAFSKPEHAASYDDQVEPQDEHPVRH